MRRKHQMTHHCWTWCHSVAIDRIALLPQILWMTRCGWTRSAGPNRIADPTSVAMSLTAASSGEFEELLDPALFSSEVLSSQCSSAEFSKLTDTQKTNAEDDVDNHRVKTAVTRAESIEHP